LRVRLTDGEAEELGKQLLLISRSSMKGTFLEELWETHYVDKRVKEFLQRLIGTTDKGLARFIRRAIPDLSPRQIEGAIRRLDVKIQSPRPIVVSTTPASTRSLTRQKRGKALKKRASPTDYGVELADIISAGMVRPPLKLFRKYKGRIVEATLLPDGTVEHQQKRYPSCSKAAEVAREAILGRPVHPNGWDFWQYDDHGTKRTLADLRQTFLSSKTPPSS
jgi:hypothetical protein